MKVLVICGHPNLKESICNATILEDIQKKMPEVEIRRLCELFTGAFSFDVAKEQEAMLKADLIVFLFPLYWYQFPGMMKQWIDDVFLHNFAYGSGNKLIGKKMLVVYTTGGTAEEFAPGGPYGFNGAQDVTKIFEAIAIFCKLDWKGSLVWHGRESFAEGDAEAIAALKEKMHSFADEVIAKIQSS